MNKSKLCKAIALATALGGVGVGLYAPTAAAVTPSPGMQLGDVLVFPYYTARNNYQTTLTFINTSADFLAVKFRFMEGYNSRDVLDFNVVMSPYDVYTGVVEAGGSTGVQFRIPSTETTCTAPYLAPNGSFAMNPVAYTGVNADGGPTTNDRLLEGYVVAIVMGHANKADLQFITQQATDAVYTLALKAAAATLLSAEHPNTAVECTGVVNLFTVGNIPLTARLFGEPTNVLKGNYSLLNVPRGTSAGGNAATLSNFFNIGATAPAGGDFVRPPALVAVPGNGQANLTCTVPYSAQFNYNAYPSLNPLPPAPVNWGVNVQTATGTTGNPVAPPPPGTLVGCPNLITPQVFPYFLEPSLNDAYNGALAGRTGVSFNFSNDALAFDQYQAYPNSSFQAVSEAFRATTVSNEWSVNPALGVSTDWVVTHPTKSFFVDDPTHASQTAIAVPNAGSTPRADVVQAAVNQARFSRNGGPAWLPNRPAEAFVAPPANIVAGQTALNPFPASFSATTASAGKSCVNVGINIWDRDETTAAGGGVTPSPIEPTAQRQLCYEVNVLNFNPPAGHTVFGSVLNVDLSGDVTALAAAAAAAGRAAEPFGWLQLNLAVDPAALAVNPATNAGRNPGVFGPLPPAGATTLNGPGLPVIGFMMRERVVDTANLLGNYGDLANHSYTRLAAPAAP